MGDDSKNSNSTKPPSAPTVMGPTPSVPAQSLDQLTGSFARPKLEPTVESADFEPTVKTEGVFTPQKYAPPPPLPKPLSGALAPLDENQSTTTSTTKITVFPTTPTAPSPVEIPRPKFSVRAMTQHFRIPVTIQKVSTLRFVHPKFYLKTKKNKFGWLLTLLVIGLCTYMYYWRGAGTLPQAWQPSINKVLQMHPANPPADTVHHASAPSMAPTTVAPAAAPRLNPALAGIPQRATPEVEHVAKRATKRAAKVIAKARAKKKGAKSRAKKAKPDKASASKLKSSKSTKRNVASTPPAKNKSAKKKK